MAKEQKSILYFIAASSPTPEEREAAEKLGTRRFRYAGAFGESDTIEKCDGVAGCAPEAYRERFPVVDAPEPPPPAPPAPSVDPNKPQNAPGVPGVPPWMTAG